MNMKRFIERGQTRGGDDAGQYGDKHQYRPKPVLQPIDAAFTDSEGEHGEAQDGGERKGHVSSV